MNGRMKQLRILFLMHEITKTMARDRKRVKKGFGISRAERRRQLDLRTIHHRTKSFRI